jgi:uracil-DNA glycosylase
VTVSREDMLRELELLPVWRLRAPLDEALSVPTLPEHTTLTQPNAFAESIAPAESMTLVEPMAVEVSIVHVEQMTAAEPVVTHVPEVAASPMVDAKVEVVAEALVIQAPEVSAAQDLPMAEPSPEPLVQSPWFLYSPQAGDATSQSLLQNIVRALQLPVEEVALHQQALSVQQVKARFAVFFGLEAANQFLGTAHPALATVRGQLFTHGDMRYVITHGPGAMLENPQLKREVWHDLCLLLAQKDAGSA